MAERTSSSIPRGRHAPPLEVRLGVQRQRLFEAAAAVFAREGYAAASAEAISREAGMSKATFYEHFANKEECILSLFDEAATEAMRAMAVAGATGDFATYEDHVRAGVRAFLRILADYPDTAQTMLVTIIGAAPRALARRGARAAGRRLPAMPAPGRLARAGRRREARGLRRRGVLGAPGPGLRRPAGARAGARSGAGRARRQQDGPDLHGRQVGRLAV